jgi:hypothetical protein
MLDMLPPVRAGVGELIFSKPLFTVEDEHRERAIPAYEMKMIPR